MFFLNPLFAQTPPRDQITLETPNQSFIKGATPLISSTPFNGIKEENTSGETTVYAASRSEERDTSTVHKYEPVDMIVKNPLFGSGLSLKKVYIVESISPFRLTILLHETVSFVRCSAGYL